MVNGTLVIMGKNDFNSLATKVRSLEYQCINLYYFFYFFSSRQKISKEGIPEVRSTIRELEAEWDRKWLDTLKDTPLVSFLNEDPVSHHWDF